MFYAINFLWDRADRMLLGHALSARFSQLHLSPIFRSIVFLDKGGCFFGAPFAATATPWTF
jgi:hypothetical protein